eukprot:m.39944 g.39944  ORF g.39944 m.39944 type:complete len:84 (-) comp5890_c0_seq1:130-381(-)
MMRLDANERARVLWMHLPICPSASHGDTVNAICCFAFREPCRLVATRRCDYMSLSLASDCTGSRRCTSCSCDDVCAMYALCRY